MIEKIDKTIDVVYEDVPDVQKLKQDDTIRTILIQDKEAIEGKRHPNNCRAAIQIHKGKSKDPRYEWYPYWSLTLLDRNNDIVDVAISKKLLFAILHEIFMHEIWTDKSRSRRSDTSVYVNKIKEMILYYQRLLDEYDTNKVPDFYWKQDMKKE
jgi:hypothetical protein